MAKRLTDTEKWKDDWFISLDNDYKIIWQWLLDNCNHAGICKRSVGLLNLMCKTNFTEEIIIDKMVNRVIIHENIWFIPKFLKFQYADLQSNRPVIVSVRRELIRGGYYKLIPLDFGNDYLIIPECLDNDYLIIKDKDKDKDKDKYSLTRKKIKNGKFSGNFKAQGEEVMLKRLQEGLDALDRDREQDS